MQKKELKKIKISKKPNQKSSRVSGAGLTAHAQPAVQKTEKINRDTSGLDGLIDSASNVSDDARDFMQPASAVPKKRGRPSNEEKAAKEQSETESAPVAPPSVSKPMFEMTFKMLSAYLKATAKDERFCLLPEEIEGLSIGWASVLDKYAPDALNKYALEISALAVTAIAGFRLHGVAKLINHERQKMNDEIRANRVPVKTVEPKQETVTQ